MSFRRRKGSRRRLRGKCNWRWKKRSVYRWNYWKKRKGKKLNYLRRSNTTIHCRMRWKTVARLLRNYVRSTKRRPTN